MRIAITGGTGYISQRLISFLISKKIKVTIISRSIKHLVYYSNNKNIEIIKINWESSKKIIFKSKVDLLIHAARTNKISGNGKNFDNIYCTKILNKVSELCEFNNIKRLIFLSSIHVYNDLTKSTFEDNQKNLNYSNNYMKEKIFFEQNFLNNKKFKNIETNILRLGNCFGFPLVNSGDCWNLFINFICKQAFIEKKIIINNNINVRRNFIPIILLNEVILYFLKYKNNPKKKYVINVVNSNSFSLYEIALLLSKKINKKYKFRPNIIIKNSDKIQYKMKINNNRLNQLGISINNKFNKELNNLIKFCHQEFYKK